MLDRVLLPSGALVVGLWAAGLLKMSPIVRKASLVIAAPVLLLAMVTYYQPGFRTDYSRYLGVIDEQWQPGDTVYHN